MISDRGGITTRPGTAIVGTHNTSASSIRGLYNFKKSKSNPDILLKTYDDEIEFLHPVIGEWARLKASLTADQEFDFTYSLVNTDNDDFTYFGNAADDYQRWNGAYTQLNGSLSGGETEIVVDSILADQTYLSETATGSSATTLVVSTATWTTDMWKNFHVHIPSTGKVRLITGNTGDTLTFSTLGGDPGSVAFEIRQLAFPLSGTVIYDGTEIAYTTIDIATELPVTSAHAAADNTAIALVTESFIDAPKGNRIDSLRGRAYVGHVKSAISRDAAGDIQGSSQAGSVFTSKLLDPTAFTFQAARVAGEGDIINIAYGKGDINDVQAFEDEIAVYKEDYIELIKYTEDVNDTAIRTPLKTGIGSVGRVIKGSDDHYFMTPDGKYTSLGRVRSKDITPQSENMGYPIKRLLEGYVNDKFTGIEYNNRLISSHKSSDSATDNDVVLIFNTKTKSFEGTWNIGANNFETFKAVADKSAQLVYGESNGANIYKMFQSKKSDIRATGEELPFTAIWKSNFLNATPLKSNIQAVNSIAIEGYITADTTFTWNLYKDFETGKSLTFDFSGTEKDFIQGSTGIARFFGSHPFGTTPISGTISEPDEDGRRRFSFIVYFPFIYGQYISSEITSSGKNQDWEIIRMSYGLKESTSVRTSNTKTT